MTEIILILLKQIGIMFLLMAAGVLLYKSGKVTKDGSREFGTVLLYMVLPCTIVNAFLTDYSREKMVALLYSFVAALLTLVAAMLIARLFFGKRYRIEHFGSAFSNAGFMGIPLVSAVIGSEAVFYVSSFVGLLNVFQWTYGVLVMTDKKDTISGKALMKNPILISLVVGFILFFLPVKLPAVVTGTLGMISNMNAPLAMLILGVYMAQLSPKELFTDKIVYLASLVRLVIIPLASILLLCIFPSSYRDIKMAVLLAASAPIGSNVAIFAQQNGMSYTQAVKGVCLSTLLSLVTMPVMLWIGLQIW